jgi:hypothetical protein
MVICSSFLISPAANLTTLLCSVLAFMLSQANDGSFVEEPGSGAVASIGEKQVSVGTLDWIQRYNELCKLIWSIVITMNYLL